MKNPGRTKGCIELSATEAISLARLVRNRYLRSVRMLAKSTFVPEPGRRNMQAHSIVMDVALHDRLLDLVEDLGFEVELDERDNPSIVQSNSAS